MRSKVIIALVLIYVIVLHIIIFNLYFEEIEFLEYSDTEIYKVMWQDDSFIEAKRFAFEIDYHTNCNHCLTALSEKTLHIYGDTLVIISETYNLYTSVFFFSDEKKKFLGHLDRTHTQTNLYYLRGNCLVSPYEQVGEYFDTDKAAELRDEYDDIGCEFKNSDSPLNIYKLKKGYIETSNSLEEIIELIWLYK